ncbi:MAG: hypothetical protein OH316_01940 [Candidatus Parvarchaeota archaeon]|nr:hypothetical protein [Candidatus Parvarchaeota archaeon]MCW1301873.1 hypothetical protein [Candidatus Parvarchaeota archaeon]
MDVLIWFGMLLMMLFIILFMYTLISNIISPNNSLTSFQNLMSMTSSACTSLQSSTSLQFSSPNSVVYQIYDGSGCNSSVLYPAQEEGYFSTSSPYDSSSSVGNYLLCYAQTTSSFTGSTGQYYFPSADAYLMASPNYFYVDGYKSAYDILQPPNYTIPNPYSLNTVVTFNFNGLSNSLQFPSNFYYFSFSGSSNDFLQEANISFFNSSSTGITYCYSQVIYNINAGKFTLNGEINFSKNCGSAIDISGINITFQSSGPQPSNANPFNVSLFGNDIVFTPPSISKYALDYQTGMCGDMYGYYKEFKKGTLVCQPIICSGSNYFLTDPAGNALEAIQGGQFSFFEVQSGGIGALQITNPNSENICDYSPVAPGCSKS